MVISANLLGPGIFFQQVHPQSKLIERRSQEPPEEALRLEEEVQKVLHRIHFVSEGEDVRRVPAESPDLNEYSSSLSNFYRVFQTLLTERFLEELPRTAVCILSGRRDCGPEADLTKAVSLDLIKPLLGLVSTVRSQTCTLGPGGAETAGASLRVGGSTSGALPGLQQSILTTLSSLPPGNLLSTLRGLVDATMTYALKLVGTLLQVPVDYVKLALQFGIRTPSLDDRDTCEQGKRVSRHVETGLVQKGCHKVLFWSAGDLKQLLMW